MPFSGKSELIKLGVNPELLAYVERIEEIVAYDIPQERAAPFQRLMQLVSSRQLESLAVWRGHHLNAKRRWFFGCYAGISVHVRGALAAAHYHADRLREIDERVQAILADPHAKEVFAGANFGLGYPRKLDSEYHAFIFACRRCLDYLTASLACSFLREADSFRTFPKSIANVKSTPEIAAALTEAHARHIHELDFILAQGRKSVRNRIAHWEFVSTGSMNLTADGFFLVGGPENLNWPPRVENPRSDKLNDAIAGRLESLHACVGDMIDTFVNSVETLQPKESEQAAN